MLLPYVQMHLDFIDMSGQIDLPHRVASSAHVSHLALQSPVPAVAHRLCWWWAEQSQGLHQLCCPSCACTDQPSGVKGQSRGQCSKRWSVWTNRECIHVSHNRCGVSTIVQGPPSTQASSCVSHELTYWKGMKTLGITAQEERKIYYWY